MQTIPRDKVSPVVIHKINLYYEYLWSVAQGFDECKDILRNLPPQIMYDAFRERYQEAIDGSLLFQSPQGDIDRNILNSLIELLTLRIYMPREFIIKAGSYGESLYFILEGEAVMFGLGNDVLGILRPGAHFNLDIGTGDTTPEIYFGKRIVHLVSLSQCTVGLVDQEHLHVLFEAFPFWKTLVRKLNCHTHFKARSSLEEFLAPTVRLDPYCNEFEVEIRTIEEHITRSTEDTYEEIVALIDLPQNAYLYNPDSEEYKAMDMISEQSKVLEEEAGIKLENLPSLQHQYSKKKTLQRRESSNNHITFVQTQAVKRLQTLPTT